MLEGIAVNPDQRLSELPMLTGPERHRLLVEWNATSTDYPRDKCIHELFEVQAERTPDTEAVIFGEQRLTYGELNKRANQLAHYLIKQGIGAEVFVGICVEQSFEMIMGILAILKAGGAYVPLDPEYPKERLTFMLEDTGIQVILTQQSMRDVLPEYSGMIMCLDSDLRVLEVESKENPISGATSNDLAYVMYTSGSTGRPKGVSVSHQAVSRLIVNTNYIKLERSDIVAQASTFSFDASTFEIWGALLNGARLALVPKDVILSPEDFASEISERKISVLFLTTAMFNQIAREVPDAFSLLRYLLFGGEVVDTTSVRTVVEAGPPQNLLHVYGPTESTTFTSWYQVENIPENAVTIPIGKPVSNTAIYILDSRLQPVPVGIVGELYIGGDGLAREYLNRPELTAEKFVIDPFSEKPGSCLYRTGDLARYLPDGNIEFKGRIDHQVKIRGYRIEPGEIEAVLGQHPDVRETIVITGASHIGDKRLAAYVVPNEMSGLTTKLLRSYLKEKLPDYMVPSFFTLLDSLPMTPNGKVDRDALPKPEQSISPKEETFVAPRSPLEFQLAKIWGKVLGIQSVGIRDNFFDLGGHSLLAVRLIAEIKKETGINLTLMAFILAPTIEQLARTIVSNEKPDPSSSLVPIQSRGSQVPLFWIHDSSLANNLDSDRPLYMLKRSYQDLLDPSYSSIEKIAACYIKDIRAFRPQGPYILGGYCFWAVVALEMGRQLMRKGYEVPLLFMLDPSWACLPGTISCNAPENDDHSFTGRLNFHAENLTSMQSVEKITYILQKLRSLVLWPVARLNAKVKKTIKSIKVLICKTHIFIGRPLPRTLTKYYYSEIHAKELLGGYTSEVSPGRVIVISSEQIASQFQPDWNCLSQHEVTVHVVPEAKHLEMVTEPHTIDLWSRWVRMHLRRIQSDNQKTGE
jgi:amino acid adenylation domain-containing protein